MSIVKSFSVGNGDMFYIRHNTSNFTIVDCCIPQERSKEIIKEIKGQASGKEIVRYISTHPDQDHISGLCELDDELNLVNFYCVRNKASKDSETEDFARYCQLRDDSTRAFYVEKGATRKWMNISDKSREHSGLHIVWPDLTDENYQQALVDSAWGLCPNNISLIVKYVSSGARFMWMGDLETEFMNAIENRVRLSRIDILFAPHHGRKTGRVPGTWLAEIDPKLIIVGEAPSEDLCYYTGYNAITQNLAGDITFQCEPGFTHIYVSNANYEVDFLSDYGLRNTLGYYLGSLVTPND